MRPLLKRSLHWAGSALAILGIAFVGLLLRDYCTEIDFARLNPARWSLVAGFALIYGLANLMPALAWRNLLGQFGIRVSRRWAVKTYGISQLAKYVPGNISHLAGRQAIGMAADVPGWPLAKSSVWELGLISFTGGLFGLLALPLMTSRIPVAVSIGAFAVVITFAGCVLWRFIAASAARACGWYVGFLAISGLLFAGLVRLLGETSGNVGFQWIPLCGAHVVAWLIGLATPGAPAGIGVREMVLLYLLKGVVGEAELILAVLLGRMVTVGGDVWFYIIAALMTSHNGEAGIND